MGSPLRKAVGSKWCQAQRVIHMCVSGIGNGRVGLSNPFGTQVTFSGGPDAGQGTAGFGHCAVRFWSWLGLVTPCCPPFFPSVPLYIGSMQLAFYFTGAQSSLMALSLR